MISDDEILRSLVHQVSKAAMSGSERDVITYISRPLWKLWCHAVGYPEDSEPTQWLGLHKTRRVYGSETVVLKSDLLFSVSFQSE